jgi:hypothetical protein
MELAVFEDPIFGDDPPSDGSCVCGKPEDQIVGKEFINRHVPHVVRVLRTEDHDGRCVVITKSANAFGHALEDTWSRRLFAAHWKEYTP